MNRIGSYPRYGFQVLSVKFQYAGGKLHTLPKDLLNFFTFYFGWLEDGQAMQFSIDHCRIDSSVKQRQLATGSPEQGP